MHRAGAALALATVADPLARNRQGATFQTYLRLANEELFHDQARAELAAIDAWLREHGVPIEGVSET